LPGRTPGSSQAFENVLKRGGKGCRRCRTRCEQTRGTRPSARVWHKQQRPQARYWRRSSQPSPRNILLPPSQCHWQSSPLPSSPFPPVFDLVLLADVTPPPPALHQPPAATLDHRLSPLLNTATPSTTFHRLQDDLRVLVQSSQAYTDRLHPGVHRRHFDPLVARNIERVWPIYKAQSAAVKAERLLFRSIVDIVLARVEQRRRWKGGEAVAVG
jgi:hypothetical protein